jgi:NAD(P)H-hydrate epimerase
MRLESLDHIVLTRRQVRSCDQIAIERYGINGLVLMENAGAAAAREILAMFDDPANARVCIVAGPGNNGGDGFVVARHLFNSGLAVELVICGSSERIAGDAKANFDIVQKMGLPIHPADDEKIASCIASANLIVDALLGTGTAGPPRAPIRSVIAALNASKKTIVALDIPSGLDCDTGEPLEITVRADLTITFAANKRGFLNPAAAAYTGKVVVASIGIHTALLMENPTLKSTVQ